MTGRKTQMSMDLVISEQGRVMIASSLPFAAEIASVDFDAESRKIILNYAPAHMPAETLELAVNDRLAPLLRQAPRVLLVAVENNAVRQGFDVPLTCIEAA